MTADKDGVGKNDLEDYTWSVMVSHDMGLSLEAVVWES
jgi:hypothetical protein